MRLLNLQKKKSSSSSSHSFVREAPHTTRIPAPLRVLALDTPFAEQFTSSPLLPGFLKFLKEVVGNDARPTPNQSLSLKWLLKHPGQWRQFLLVSETGSGKSIAYLLPLLQNLKETELMSSSQPFISEKRLYNPRGLILAPTHELTR